MKRIFKTLLMLSFVAMLVSACSAPKEELTKETTGRTETSQTLVAGTYTAESQGNNGPIKVSVTVDESSIIDVSVVSHKETEGLSDAAIIRIPETIVKDQTLAVDTISGATNSSNAVLESVTDCIKQAGGDPDAFMLVSENTDENKEKVSLEYDVVVVGGGGAGMSAAISASNLGSEVLLLEKMSYLGGAASISGGQVNGGGSEFQANLGYQDSTEEIFMDIMRGGNFLNDAKITWEFAKNVGPTFDWLIDTVGIEFNEVPTPYGEHGVERCFPADGFAKGITESFLKTIEEASTKVMLETAVYDLIETDGVIEGVLAKDASGTMYEIKAESVILATGGFGANKDMLPDRLSSVLYYGPVSSTGDGHNMVTSVGGVLQNTSFGKINPQGIEYAPGLAKSTSIANRSIFNDTGSITVNSAGKRVVNERGLLNDFGDQIEIAEDKTLYIVMDQSAFDIFSEVNIANNVFSQDDIDKWIDLNGEDNPIFVKNEVLSDAAKAAGIDETALAETIENYNSFVANGIDEDFNREVSTPMGEGPYYIVEQKLRFATTLGGVKISTNLEVLNSKDEPISGLYAAGELVGGVHGDTSIPSNNVGWAFTSGRMVGEIVSKLILNK